MTDEEGALYLMPERGQDALQRILARLRASEEGYGRLRAECARREAEITQASFSTALHVATLPCGHPAGCLEDDQDRSPEHRYCGWCNAEEGGRASDALVEAIEAERDRLRAALARTTETLRQCANLTRNQEVSPATVAEVGRTVQAIAASVLSDPDGVRAVEEWRARLEAEVADMRARAESARSRPARRRRSRRGE